MKPKIFVTRPLPAPVLERLAARCDLEYHPQDTPLSTAQLAEACREAEGVLPPRAFGHTGFTGTSVFLDPEAGRISVLLTNRVHPQVREVDMNGLRRRFHEIARELA